MICPYCKERPVTKYLELYRETCGNRECKRKHKNKLSNDCQKRIAVTDLDILNQARALTGVLKPLKKNPGLSRLGIGPKVSKTSYRSPK